jgi:predicted TIM-barrel fold metal-dependent hydrolase
MGRPDSENPQRLLALARHPNLYLKFTTHNVRDASSPQAFMRRVIDAFGAQRIAWGSNYPASAGSLAQLLGDARDAISLLSASEQQQILSGTANTLHEFGRARP